MLYLKRMDPAGSCPNCFFATEPRMNDSVTVVTARRYGRFEDHMFIGWYIVH